MIGYEDLLGVVQQGPTKYGTQHFVLRSLGICSYFMRYMDSDGKESVHLDDLHPYPTLYSGSLEVPPDALEINGQLFLIIEYCNFGSLLSYLRARRKNGRFYSHVDEDGNLLEREIGTAEAVAQIL
ncbi:hypothetical protein BV898_04494 [Hypsibius exemplaris]|uniref:Protein kinase domain-containing protein n=1 Tax=Hypsibius exemplaris TaxID=2072580 RepID=A0A1W0X290_HYPEX|nr:hypothetical protein BV898_04494 [Hypsibius exemplaris]